MISSGAYSNRSGNPLYLPQVEAEPWDGVADPRLRGPLAVLHRRTAARHDHHVLRRGRGCGSKRKERLKVLSGPEVARSISKYPEGYIYLRGRRCEIKFVKWSVF